MNLFKTEAVDACACLHRKLEDPRLRVVLIKTNEGN